VTSQQWLASRFEMPTRSQEPELMDESTVKVGEMQDVLDEVTWLNFNFGNFRPIFDMIRAANRVQKINLKTGEENRVVRVCDLGCGQGDLLKKIYTWSQSSGVAVELVGIDMHSSVVAVAERACRGLPIQIYQSEAVQFVESSRGKEVDIYISSLFTHHLTDDMIVVLMRAMAESARFGWYIDDLQRSSLSRFFVGLVTRVGRFHKIVRHDAIVSVERGFRLRDWYELADRARLAPEKLRIQWRWAFRFGVSYLNYGSFEVNS
jgi:SAM-dependent methyltransferase